ncbi:MAG: hypothetical protein ACYTG7_26680 [Planctomycetota bacterium]|jgi:hypothetical protein
MFTPVKLSLIIKRLSSIKGMSGGAAIVALALLVLCPCVLGQTNWSVEGGIPAYGEFNMPPALALTNPMPYIVFPAPPPIPPMPPMAPFPVMVPQFGGSAVDNDGNPLSGGPAVPAMIHSDGTVVEVSDPATGLFITSFVVPGPFLPGPVSGIGYDSIGDIIWLTDGVMCTGLALPVAPGALPVVVVPPFPLPLAAGALASGLGWDSWTGTLWFCEDIGNVTNCAIGGALLVTFPAVGLALPLMGLDTNSTNGNVQVTDGFTVAEYMPGGALAPPGAFYLAANPYPIPLWGAPVSGLGFSLRPQRYGAGYSTVGTPPAIGFGGGYSFAGNMGFTISETGATIGSIAYLMYGFAPAVPGMPIGGFPGATVWFWPVFSVVYLGPVTTGTVTIPVRIPAPGAPGAPPVGAPVFVQFFNIISTGPTVVEITDALSFTIGQV